jgi:hypothetical protein
LIWAATSFGRDADHARKFFVHVGKSGQVVTGEKLSYDRCWEGGASIIITVDEWGFPDDQVVGDHEWSRKLVHTIGVASVFQ